MGKGDEPRYPSAIGAIHLCWLYANKRLNQRMFSRFAKLVARQKRSKPIVDYRPALCFIRAHEVFRKRFWYLDDLSSTTILPI